mmetsp:Transcript_8983/g.9719  ORF Transcript_8983/g.9719 Transcript_8983/m.9719 type:complete len:163 (+) Transcript_8983:291-779(+)|eukprot:CAMPEP_0115006636 /NCGR_PEP_ID=MMETSP0216-20121206/20624_1 /TAXON_ID=223996 /ORGANISM="Protocruzia adherens, Strain Boccale" /LENGTH=162 /DNA_ID=CAMNT_0002373269 /DNA_START=244 /DNA_END=732 /DNA_ORIENTATION=+
MRTIAHIDKTAMIEIPICKKFKEGAITKEYEKRDPDSFVCRYPGCPSRFQNHFNLRRHVLLIHMKRRLFECEFCKKKFGLAQHLKEHLSIHKSREAVEEYFPKVNISILDRLPIFWIEQDREENFLQEYIRNIYMPTFVLTGNLEIPDKLAELKAAPKRSDN